MATKKGIGSYPADDPGSDQSGDVNPDENMGANKPHKDGKGELADPERVQRDLDRYRDEMAEDAPDSGSAEDRS